MVPSYGGLAGAVTRHFVRISSLFTAFPALVVLLVVVLAVQWLAHLAQLPEPFPWLLAIISTAPVTGRFGLAACKGEFQAGFFAQGMSAGLLGFTLRYAALVLAWGIPLALINLLLLRFELFGATGGGLLGAAGSAKAVLAILLTLLVLAAWVLLPTVSLIVCLASDDVRTVFTVERWRWVFGARRGDLVVFYALTIGGMFLFVLIGFPGLALLDAILFALEPRVGMAFMPVMIGLPAAGAAVLSGRLAGAFVAAEYMDAASDEPKLIAVTPTAKTETTPGARQSSRRGSVPSAAALRPSDAQTDSAPNEVQLFLQKVRDLDPSAGADTHALIEEGEALAVRHPKHLQLLYEISKLAHQSDDTARAATFGSRALGLALDGGANAMAGELYENLRDDRNVLPLTAEQWEKLSRLLMQRQVFADAIWCLNAAGARGSEALRVQKGIIAVAEAAVKADKVEEAVSYYEYFIKKFPDSSFCDYCQQQVALLRK